jgi:hypothetical protein
LALLPAAERSRRDTEKAVPVFTDQRPQGNIFSGLDAGFSRGIIPGRWGPAFVGLPVQDHQDSHNYPGLTSPEKLATHIRTWFRPDTHPEKRPSGKTPKRSGHFHQWTGMNDAQRKIYYKIPTKA